ncbi:MAG: COX15/CtaA family protein [Bdellovibrionales bacterium]|nr:COX15/CtaA family protein [Bdellovibrionales bacterium]
MKTKTFSYILSFLIFLTFDLMVLGAGVRAMDAGLTCPDWPLCFGRVVPTYHLGVYLEFIHRAIAGLVALIFIFCFIIAHIKSEYKHLRFTFWISAMLLFSQIIMGGLTVLKLLQPGIVTLHLSLAGVFLASLVILKSKLTEDSASESVVPLSYKIFSTVALVSVSLQIILGGKVATTYSGSVCLDFPTCMGQWFPTFYGPIGLQVMHRLGAYAVSLIVLILFVWTLKLLAQEKLDRVFKILSSRAILFVLSQVAIGVMNLKMQIPPWLTVIHLAMALMIFLTLLRMNIRAWSANH